MAEVVVHGEESPDAIAARKRIVNRLRRANGQLNALIAAVEAGDPCRDIVTQLAAVRSALDKAGFAIVSSTLRDCLEDPVKKESEDGITVEEVEKLFLMLA